MVLGKIVGNVTATRKQDALKGFKLLVIQARTQLKHDDATLGPLFVAIDLMGAGPGEEVLVATGRAARIAAGREDLPVDAAVVGIVDNAAS